MDKSHQLWPAIVSFNGHLEIQIVACQVKTVYSAWLCRKLDQDDINTTASNSDSKSARHATSASTFTLLLLLSNFCPNLCRVTRKDIKRSDSKCWKTCHSSCTTARLPSSSSCIRLYPFVSVTYSPPTHLKFHPVLSLAIQIKPNFHPARRGD